jgi:hypothetical protein
MDMEENERLGLARRASPYGLAVLPEQDTYEYTDSRNEEVVERRWRPVCERHGAAVLGVRAVPTDPMRIDLDGIQWELRALDATEERGVPSEVYHRWRALEAESVPFYYWLWGEELPVRPRFQPLSTTNAARPATRVTPPAARTATWSERLNTWLDDAAAILRDPIVIGVIPTAPNRGLWVLIGRWFH